MHAFYLWLSKDDSDLISKYVSFEFSMTDFLKRPVTQKKTIFAIIKAHNE